MTLKRLGRASPSLPKALSGWTLVGDGGLPRFWACVWETLHGAALSEATLSSKLSSIDRFYRSVAEQTGADCLDNLIAAGDFERLEACLEGFLVSVRNSSVIAKTDRSGDWRTALTFVRDLLERRGRSMPATEASDRLQMRLNRFDRLHATLQTKRAAKAKALRALPASVIEDLYEIIEPASKRNPFRSEGQRWRNYALLLLYLHQGLRRGEALLLPLDAIKTDFDHTIGEVRTWMNVTTNQYEYGDPRYIAPQLKTALSHRQIPVAETVADIVQHYVENYRGRQDHTFLFPSNRHRPLAVNSVTKVFNALSAQLSPAAHRDLNNRLRSDNIKAHDCRHTCAVVRLAGFVAETGDMEVALQSMRVFFGWSKTSEMPRHYARAYFEDRLISVWQKKFDDRVEVLRRIGELERTGVLDA